MASLRTRIATITGTISANPVIEGWADEASRKILRRLPEETLELMATAGTDADGKLGTGGVALAGKIVAFAHKKGYICKEVRGFLDPLIVLDASEILDARNPVFFRTMDGGVLKGFVRPGGGTVMTAEPPVIDPSKDPSAVWPTLAWEDAVLYFCISRELTVQARVARDAMPTAVKATKPAPDASNTVTALNALTPTASPSTTPAIAPTPAAISPIPNATKPSTGASKPTPVTGFTMAGADITAIQTVIDELDALDTTPPSMTTFTATVKGAYPSLTYTKPTITVDWTTRWEAYYAVADTEVMNAVARRKQLELEEVLFELRAEVSTFETDTHKWLSELSATTQDMGAEAQHSAAEFAGEVQLYNGRVAAKARELEFLLQKVVRVFEVQKTLELQSKSQEQQAFATEVQQEGVDVQAYRGQVDQEQVEAAIFRAEIELEAVKVQNFRAEIDQEGVDVQIFSASIDLETVKVQNYSAQVTLEQVKAQNFRVQVEQESIEAQIYQIEGALDESAADVLHRTKASQYQALRAESARWFNLFSQMLREVLLEMRPQDHQASLLPSI